MRTKNSAPRTLWLGAALVTSTALAAACGSGGGSPATFHEPGSGDDGGLPTGDPDSALFAGDADPLGDADIAVDSLAFDPPVVTVTVDGTTPKTASYTLKATKDGRTFPVTPRSIQFDRPDLAKAQLGAPVVLTSAVDVAGTGTLHGVFGGKEATAKLSVVVNLVEVGPGVDPRGVTALGGAGLGQDPAVSSLLYPYDQTVFPLGMTTPLLMWAAPSAADVYRVHLEQKSYTYDGYFVAAMPGQLRVAQATWDKLTASNGGDPLKLTLSRWDAAQNKAYASASQSWTLAPASLRGAIYYWTTSAGGHMSRIRPGTGAQPEVLNGGKCMGCHAVSADGTTLVASVEDQPSSDDVAKSGTKRGWVSFDLPGATTKAASTLFSGNVAVNPDGKFVVYGDQTLKLGDSATGLQIPNSGLETMPKDTGMSGFMTPAFSPDGKKLAMVEGAGTWYHDLINGKLVVVDFDASTKTFSNLVALAPASSFAASQRAISYPSFTPDSAQIAFHVADYPTGCDRQGTCVDTTTQIGSLWLQGVSGSAPVKLDKLNDSAPSLGDHNLSLEPTFNPVERGGYFWVVFTSMRDWGNKITGAPDNGKKRLWVAAIDKATGASDPSHPPFFLEGQEEATTNMRGFWALAACTPTPGPGGGGGQCQAGFECCSGFCDRGTCVDTGTIACRGVGDSCKVDGDCCNAGSVTCVAGTCAPVTTR
jgi:WD40-like Beta Propeller Repeat